MRHAFTDVGLIEVAAHTNEFVVPSRGKLEDQGKQTPGARVVGINLGFDFCAEHEWGYAGIKQKLGVIEKKHLDSFEDIKIPGKNPAINFFMSSKGYAACGTIRGWGYEKPDFFEKEVKRYIKENSRKLENEFISFWDRSDFLIIGIGKCAKHVENLYDALYNGNAAIKQGQALFGGGGLCFFYVDKLPSDVFKKFNESCDDLKNLHAVSDATGIAIRLEAAGKRYYALSPRWTDKSKKTVSYWLNPMEQQTNNYGSFTVEELDQWIAGTGPIPKTKVSV